MSIKHDRCQAWETEIVRLRQELRRSRKIIVGLCDMTIDTLTSLKVMDENVEIEVAMKNINQLKEKYQND